MPNALSADLRSRFRKLFDEGLTGREIGRQLMISAASASRLVQKIKLGVSLDPVPNRRKTGHGKLVPYTDFLIELVHQDPDISLQNCRARWSMHMGCGPRSRVSIRHSSGLTTRTKKEPHCG